MKKFVGELGEITQPILIIYSSKEIESSVKISKSLMRVFDSFLKVITLDIEARNFKKNFTKLSRKASIAFLTTPVDPSILAHAKKRSKILLHGFMIEKDFSGRTPAGKKSFAHYLDKITVAQSPSSYMKRDVKSKKYDVLSLAFDPRPYLNVKAEGTKSDSSTLGLFLGRESKRELERIVTECLDALAANPKSKLRLLAQNLEYEVESQLPRLLKKYPDLVHRFEVINFETIENKVEFFRAVDLVGVSGKANPFEETFAEAEAAQVRLVELTELISALKKPAKSRIHHESSETHPSDFRTIRYEYISTFLTSTPTYPTSHALTLIPADAGFFSVFNTLVSVKAYWIGQHGFSLLQPDWAVNSVLKFWKTNKLTSYCYAGRSEGNVFPLLFHGWEHSANLPAPKRRVLSHSPNLYPDPDLTYVFADRLYRSVGFKEWRLFMNKALGNLRPNDAIMNEINETFSLVKKDDFVIGMHVRHPSHAMEQPNSEIPLANDYIRVAKNLISSRKGADGKTYVFLATDQEAVAEEFRAVFGNKLLLFGNVTRVTKKQTSEYESLSAKDQLKVGHQVQHIAASNQERWSSNLAGEIIRDVWGLAQSDVLVHSVSNVATAVAYINPDLESIPIRKRDDLELARLRLRLAKLTSLI